MHIISKSVNIKFLNHEFMNFIACIFFLVTLLQKFNLFEPKHNRVYTRHWQPYPILYFKARSRSFHPMNLKIVPSRTRKIIEISNIFNGLPEHFPLLSFGYSGFIELI